ncbi:Fungal-specific transcription factor domain-containing protein [Pleurostoma richardsiae]|uniref:Fungal-specific transcription factor domain-containing protein n=1 Tax=Pleurostoma richardsiae TaxID=41990 RepID=A0AA38R5C2_9PEZI|nr:Fungal-specific transcription factor domain-containing protein [Pleurostoma richardsiae]
MDRPGAAPLSPAASAPRSAAASGSTTPVSKPKRSSVACRRCRRLRTKCLQDEHHLTPCLPCRDAGPAIAKDCAFASRGDNADRRFRIKRVTHVEVSSQTSSVSSRCAPSSLPRRLRNGRSNAVESTTRDAFPTPSRRRRSNDNESEGPPFRAVSEQASLSPSIARRVQVYAASDDIWSLLPPHEELLAGCRVYLTTCLQVGFIPKALFLEQMENSRESVNVFLLLSILGISARFTPELCERFHGSKNAAEFFMDVAHVMIADEMWNTNLENTQAFFLLGMADWGRGERERSAINMGIAVRMAGVLRLHREETYRLPPGASADQVVDAERARRTFWVIQNHDNLYTQEHLPLSFGKSDITTLLPGEESDFAFGRVPQQRAALAGTVPALRDPSLASLPTRSLFSTLIQAHDLWGIIARDARGDDDASASEVELKPWHPNSQYRCMAKTLREWEANIPSAHTWSPWNLRGYKAEHVDLAYLSIVTVTRLNNIVLRRTYLDRIVKAMVNEDGGDSSAPAGFWEQMSLELFTDAWSLYEAVDVWFSLRGVNEGFPAMLAFCTYVCGSLASHLYRWPQLCPKLAPAASTALRRCVDVLSTFEEKWPTASQWSSVLRQVADQAPYHGSRPVDDVRSQEALLNTPAPQAYSPAASRTSHATLDHPSPNIPARPRASSPYQTQSHPVEGKIGLAQPVTSTGTMPVDMYQGDHALNSANHLHLLSRAAAYDSGMSGEFRKPGSEADETTLGHAYETSVMGPDAYRHAHRDAAYAGPPGPSGLVHNVAPLPDPLDFDFTDFTDCIQGYMHIGWTGWQQ